MCDLFFQALARLRELQIEVAAEAEGGREMLIQCASTTLNSKLIAGQKVFFANMIVDAIKVSWKRNKNSNNKLFIVASLFAEFRTSI